MPTGVKGLLFGPLSQTKPPAPTVPAFLPLPRTPWAFLAGVGGGLGNLGAERVRKCSGGPGTEPGASEEQEGPQECRECGEQGPRPEPTLAWTEKLEGKRDWGQRLQARSGSKSGRVRGKLMVN